MDPNETARTRRLISIHLGRKRTSPTYTSNADDSGFVEMCPPIEADDNDVWQVRRDIAIQSPKIAPTAASSTPNSRTLPDGRITNFPASNISPIHIMQYHPSPFATGSYFLAHDGRQNFNLEQPKIIFNTVLDKAACAKIDQVTQNQQNTLLLAGNPTPGSLEVKPATNKDASDVKRGHSTIASLLNSLPLNLVTIAKDQSEFVPFERSHYGDLSLSKTKTISDEVYRTICVPEIKHNTENETKIDNIQFEEANDLKDTGKVPSTQTNDPDSELPRGYNETCRLSDICRRNDTHTVDENNNFRLAQKYSDISDACASETGTTTDTSSSEEEQIDNSELSRKCVTKVKQRRKSNYPRRSAVKEDPRFKGVTVWLQTSFKNGRSSLQISAFYSNVKLESPSRRYPVYQRRCSTPRCSSLSDQESNSPAYVAKEPHVIAKTCASCKTRRTPLWRDADDGTPLCNACGIRYKKYRLRCSKCWHIPKKEVKTYPNCPACGASLRFSFHKKTW